MRARLELIARLSLPPLHLAALVIPLVALTSLNLSIWSTGWKHADLVDFERYYLAAQIALAHGPAAAYIPHFWRSFAPAGALDPHKPTYWLYTAPYPELPWHQWLFAPLTRLRVPVAYGIWDLALLVALAVAWWAGSSGVTSRTRLAIRALAATAFYPFGVAVFEGQPVFAVVLALVACVWLYERDHPYWAGAALGLSLFKPQEVFFVAPVLLVARQWKPLASFAAVSVVLAAAATLYLGAGGVNDYLAEIRDQSGIAVYQDLTLRHFTGAAALPVGVLIGLGALLAAWRWRDRGLRVVLAAGVLGSLLLTPHMNPQDLMVLVALGWLLAPVFGAWWARASMWLVFAGVWLIGVFGALAALLPLAVWLLMLAALPRDWLVLTATLRRLEHRQTAAGASV